MQLCDRIGVAFYGEKDNSDAVGITRHGIVDMKRYDVIVVDTAGRHALESDLIREMELINEMAKAEQRLLVLDAAIGQQASEQAKAFNEAVGIQVS